MDKSYRSIGVMLLLLVLGMVSLPTPGISADAPAIHVVSWGDTLGSISARYGTSVNAVMQANNLRNPDFIYIGQRLLIPGNMSPVPAPAIPSYVVQAGDTLFSIANRYGTTVGALMQTNRLYNYWIYVGQTLRLSGQAIPQPLPVPVPYPLPLPQGMYYTVRYGDYLELLAARYGSSVYAIQIANRLANPSFIYPGQRLFIPGAPVLVNLPPLVAYVPPPAPPVVPPYIASPTPVPSAPTWEGLVLSNTKGTGPCSLAVTVAGKTNWPVVLASVDTGAVVNPKLTGTKPERGPYVVEFAQSCTGTWRVIPVGLGTFVDVVMLGGHAEVEFHLRAN